MRVFPFLAEDFTSPLPPAELLRCVHDAVQAKREFRGTVGESGFTIRRVGDNRSMPPRITGRVAAGPVGGSRLHLTHALHPFTLVFSAVWLLGAGGLAVGVAPILINGFRAVGWRELASPNCIPLGMLAFGVLLLLGSFWLEVHQSRPRLLALLHLQAAAPARPMGP